MSYQREIILKLEYTFYNYDNCHKIKGDFHPVSVCCLQHQSAWLLHLSTLDLKERILVHGIALIVYAMYGQRVFTLLRIYIDREQATVPTLQSAAIVMIDRRL